MNRVPALVLSFLLIFMSVPQGFAAPPAGTLPAQVATYDGLVHAIREVRAAAQTRIEQAVEQERVREAWEIGKLIDEHVLQHRKRADYGKQVIERLAGDLEMDRTELYRMLAFARAYPIVVPGQQLSWSHYKALLPIEDPEKREAIAEEAVRGSWDRDRLREEIRKRRLSEDKEEIASVSRPLIGRKGVLDTYRIVMLEGRLVINLGFSNYLELSRKDAKRFKEGDIVRVSKGKPKLVKGATESLVPFQLFSYHATVLEITDGDTFWALVDLGFGFTTKQQLRLRGLDAPEIETADGQRAKAFLERELLQPSLRGSATVLGGDASWSSGGWPPGHLAPSGRLGEAISAPIIITASKSDKYDRYLADVWAGEKYINQELLDKGHAVRVSE